MTYIDCMNQITKDDLYEGLLGYGLFSDRLPPFLTSVPYYKYSLLNPFNNKQYCSQYIFFDNYRNINIPRTLAIPTPFAYENLCKELFNDWDKLQQYFKQKTLGQSYKVSRIHIRKLAKTKALFKMNYDNWKIDGFPEPDLIIDKKYMVKADISDCFPSMYTHSLPWALVGKSVAKQNIHDKNTWYNKIDSTTQKIRGKETHGFLIGPHVSNLLSEIILSDIDSRLTKKWEYIRKIDDYSCYVKSKEDGEQFLLDLVIELKKYELLLNQRKVSIIELPQSSENDWVIKLNKAQYLLCSSQDVYNYNNVRNYLDTVIELAKINNNDSIISYAFKVLSGLQNSSKKSKKKEKKSFSENAIKYIKKISVHYTLLHPYLIQFYENTMILPFDFSQDEIMKVSNYFYNEGIRTRNYELCCYSLLFSIKNSSIIKKINIDEIIDSNHCILLLLSYLYSDKNRLISEKQKLYELALTLSKDKEDFDRNWLFVYEVLHVNDLHNEYKTLKTAHISFIDNCKLTY